MSGFIMATELIRRQVNTCTLYELEDNLEAFANTIDLADDEPTRRFILDEIGHALRRAKDKRDVVLPSCGICEMHKSSPTPRSRGFKRRKRASRRSSSNWSAMWFMSSSSSPGPIGEASSTLKETLSSLRIQKNPDSVLVTDVDVIPVLISTRY